MASGVTQPAHNLVRGKTLRSSSMTSRPASRSFQAQVDPAGPPPTTMASATFTSIDPRTLRILVSAGPRYMVVCTRREQDLVELQRAGLESSR